MLSDYNWANFRRYYGLYSRTICLSAHLIEFLRFESQLILAPEPTGLNKSCNGMNLRRVKPKMISSSLVELLDG